MGLFVPILLLGFAQPAALPPSNSFSHVTQEQFAASRQFTDAPRQFELSGADEDNSTSTRPFDRIVIDHESGEGPSVCLTMRSYYFHRRDGLAPEFVGMTTCDRLKKRALKNINRPARLVPAN